MVTLLQQQILDHRINTAYTAVNTMNKWRLEIDLQILCNCSKQCLTAGQIKPIIATDAADFIASAQVTFH
jgi:hypothetical protein